MTLKEILDKRKECQKAAQDLVSQSPALPCVENDKGGGFQVLDDYGRVRLLASSNYFCDYEAKTVDFIVREWLKLRPEALQEQEAKP